MGVFFLTKEYDSLDELHYSHVFTPLITDRYITHLTTDMDVKTIPAGRYVCIAFIFEPDTYLTQYQKLYHYIEEHQLQVLPVVYEIFMPLNYSPNGEDQFIVELKVKLL